MNLIVPISYFNGTPRSELWIVDPLARRHYRWRILEESDRSVRGKGVTGIDRLNDSNYLICDFNRVLVLDMSGHIVHSRAAEDMNDLHSVTSVPDGVLVTNTGRDAVELLGHDLTTKFRWSGISETEWLQRVDGHYEATGSYFDEADGFMPFCMRRLPDRHHVNYAVKLPDGRYVGSSLTHRAYIDLSTWRPISQVLAQPPHDGCLHQGRLWVTTVDGNVYSTDTDGDFRFVHLFSLFDNAPHHGWCRGLYYSAGKLFIGITAIQEVSSRTSWLKRAPKETKTGIYQLCVDSLQIEHFYDFSHPDGARIFSMTEALAC